MFNRWSMGMKLANACWRVLRQKRGLLVFPLLSTVAMIFITALFFIPIAGLGLLNNLAPESGQVSDTTKIVAAAVGLLYYFIGYIVVIYSNTALVGAVMLYMRGEPSSVGAGLRIANARLGKITGYALIAATVGLIARAIARSGRGSRNIVVAIVAALIGGAIAAAWNVITFMVVPVLVVENVGPIAAIKQSFELFKRTWGERLVGGFSLGIISFLLALAALVPGGVLVVVGVMSNIALLIVAGIAVAALGLVFVALLTNAAQGIFQAALYSYATTGNAGMYIDTNLVRDAFRPKM